jgi:hypothetical protein
MNQNLIFLFLPILVLLLGINVHPTQTYTFIQDGNWTYSPTWQASDYIMNHTICENANTGNSSLITVAAPMIEAIIETYPLVDGIAGVTLVSVLTSDTYDGNPATTSNIDLTVGIIEDSSNNDASANISVDSEGIITVSAGTAAGTYNISYEICDKVNTSDCSSAIETVIVKTPGIEAIAENYPSVDGIVGATLAASIFTSDTYNGGSATTSNIDLTVSVIEDSSNNDASANISVDSDGIITVAAGTLTGTYSISYKICDMVTTSNCSTVTETVSIFNNSTAAVDDYNNTAFKTAVSGDVGVNDFDNDGDTQTYALDGVNGGMNLTEGAVILDADGSYVFTPTVNFSGETSFDYNACDDGTPQSCELATVFIEVLPIVNTEGQPIIANLDVHNLETGIIGAGNVLSNDLDPDGGKLFVSTPLTSQSVSGTDTQGSLIPNVGELTLKTDGFYKLVLNDNFVGTITQLYTACNDETPQDCDNTKLVIDVIPNEGNSTFANDDAIITDVGVEVSSDVSMNDTDSEGDIQKVVTFLYDSDGDGLCDASGTTGVFTTISGTNENGVFMANVGSLLLVDNGKYIFAPAAGFVGNAMITYTSCDNNVTQICDDAILVITVLDANRDYGDAPAGYPEAWHRAISDTDDNKVLDGSTNVWLGRNTDFETVDNTSAAADGDRYDDAMLFGSNVGQFPLAVSPLQNFDVVVTLNGEITGDEVFYGMWIDWNNDGSYDAFYKGSGITNSPVDVTVNITTPAGVSGTEAINIRLRADDTEFFVGNAGGARTNGEVEDYQATVTLPVELSSFEGTPQNCNVQLNWASETEENFDHYEIEWSNDSETWRQVDIIYGTGGINTQYYQFLHEEADHINYYRLKMVDLDGTYEYSNIVNVITACSAVSDLILYPNPGREIRGVVSVKFLSNKWLEETVTITDILGRVVKHMEITVQDSWNTFDADISGLPRGYYTLKMENSEISKMFIIAE